MNVDANGPGPDGTGPDGTGTDVTRRVLHGVRLLGYAGAPAVAARAGLTDAIVSEELLDQQAMGRTIRSEFEGSAGWSLTDRGRAENERLLAAELAGVTGGRDRLSLVYDDDFLPANARLQQAVTDWQLKPSPDDPLAPNTHEDVAWDAQVLDTIEQLLVELTAIEDALTPILSRFAGYHGRFADALTRQRIDNTADSCHRVWFELHEDLLATLGIHR